MIEYIMDLLNIHWGYYLAAIVIGLMVWIVTKKWSISLFWTYCFFATAITVLSRDRYVGMHYQPHLFWSWSVPTVTVRNQLVMNIVGFIPFGILLAPSFGWKSVPTVTFFSFIMEILQLVLQRGLFEFDDVLHNTIGALIGVGLFRLFVGFRIPKIRGA